MFKIFSGVVLLCCGLACEAQALDADMPPDALSAIPDVQYTYYDVSGASLRAIYDSLRHSPERPRDDSGKTSDTVSNWHINWSWKGEYGTAGQCRVTEAEIGFKSEVTLPRLVGSPSVYIREQWNKFLLELRNDAAAHLGYAMSRLDDVRNAVLGSACVAVDASAEGVLVAIRAHDHQVEQDEIRRENDKQKQRDLPYPFGH